MTVTQPGPTPAGDKWREELRQRLRKGREVLQVVTTAQDEALGRAEARAGILTAPTDDAGEWEAPIPLDTGSVPPFPVEALGPLAEYVGAVAEALQVPPDLPGGLALSVIAAALARKCRVEARRKYSEPLNIYTLTLLESGNRKTATVEAVTAPLVAVEADLLARAEPEIAAVESQRRIREGERSNLERDAARLTADSTERERSRRAALSLARELAETDAPVRPRLLVNDVTPEQLGYLLAEQGGVLACFSAEAEIFGPMMGRYAKDGQPNLDVYLKGHSGDDHRVDRGTRKPVTVRRPALTLGVSVQPAALESLTRDPTVRGRGLLGRFLYTRPTSLLGYRNTEPQPVPDIVEAQWANLVRWLCALPRPPVEYVLTLSPEAYRVHQAFDEEVEKALRPGEPFHTMQDWAGKLPGATLRLSAILHAAEAGLAGREPWATPIGEPIMAAAVRLGRFYAAHAAAVFELMGTDPVVAGAQRLLAWIKRRGAETFTKRDAHYAHRAAFPRAADLDAPLRLLVERYWIRPLDPSGNGKPGRKSERYVVHPAGLGDARE